MEFILILIVVIGALIIIGRLQDKKEQNSTVETEAPYKVETTPSPIIQQSEPLADTVTVTVSESVNTVSIVTPPEPVKEEVVKPVAKKAAPAKKTAKTSKETAKEPTPAPAKKTAKAAVVKTESKVSTKRSSKKA
jgi:hypothetical protein